MRLRLVKSETNIDFFKNANSTFGLSICAMFISILCFLLVGLNYGIDFRGGTMIMMKVSDSTSVNEVRTKLIDL